MNKHMLRRLLSALAITALLASMAVSCSDTSSGEADVTETQDTVETTAAETEPERQSGLPDKDWEGRTMTFITRSSEYGAWETFDIFTDTENGETLNDALYQRNVNVEEKYNVKIAENKQATLASVITQLVQAGDSSFDAAVTSGSDGCNLSNALLLVDLHSIPNLDLSNEWWDQNAVKDFAIGSKLFITVGDILFSDRHGGWIYTFNKDIADDFGIEYPYQMALDGTWTYEAFYDLAKQVPADLNGDGQMTGDADRFGIATERYDTYAAFFYSGARIFSNDNAEGYPEYVANDERAFNAYDKYYEIVSDTNTYFKGNTGNVSDGVVFKEGRALFRGTTLNNIRFSYREHEFDFGLVVAPKYDEAQENYGHIVSIGSSASVVSVPQTSPDLEFTGFVLEALCFESTETLLDAYITVAFNNKYLRDDESIKMLQMNIDSRVFDFSIIYTGWGGWFSDLFAVSATVAPTLSSKYASTVESVEAQIDQTFKNFKDQ